MEAIKQSNNVEFDVIYADGTTRHVREGVLFEANGENMVFHNGTDRAEVLFATIEAVVEIATDLGLLGELQKYLTKQTDEESEE